MPDSGAEEGAVAGTAAGVGVGVGVAVGAATDVATGAGSTDGGSVGGVRVGTNSVAFGFSEAELGLTEATAVGAATWRIAGTAAVRGCVVRTAVGLIGSTRWYVG